jgi:hypothetical protein
MIRSLSLASFAFVLVLAASILYGPLHAPLGARAAASVRLSALQKRLIVGGQCPPGQCQVEYEIEDPVWPYDYGGCCAVGGGQAPCSGDGCVSWPYFNCGHEYTEYADNCYVKTDGSGCSDDWETYYKEENCSRQVECVTTLNEDGYCDERYDEEEEDYWLGCWPTPPGGRPCKDCSSEGGDWTTTFILWSRPCPAGGSY